MGIIPMLFPIVVVDCGHHYGIIAGERRWIAVRAGLKEVPVIIRKNSENEITEIAFIEEGGVVNEQYG